MTKQSVQNLSILTLTSLLIAGGVLWYADSIKEETRIIQKQAEEQQSAVFEKRRQEGGNRNITSLDDLIAKAEPMTFPEIDTSDWNTYRSEELGIEFKYPEDWKVYIPTPPGDPIDILCLGTKDERFRKPESGGECSLQIELREQSSIVSDINQWISSGSMLDMESYKSIMDEKKILWIEGRGLRIFVLGERDEIVMAWNVWPEDIKNELIRTAFYGFVLSEKDISE